MGNIFRSKELSLINQEYELENELEGEFEYKAKLGEHEQGEQFLGNILSGLFGEEEGEFEYEQGEHFGIFHRIAKLARSAAPILKEVARIAAPITGKAVGGLLGGPAGAVLGSQLASLAAQDRHVCTAISGCEFHRRPPWQFC